MSNHRAAARRPVGMASARLSAGKLARIGWAVLAWLLLPCTAWAHAFWMVPFAPAVGLGDRVALDFRIGPGWPGESTPRLPGMVAEFQVIDAQGSRVVDGRAGGTPGGHFQARSPGTSVASMRTHPSTIVLLGAAFQDYLREEGLDDALQYRAAMGIADLGARENFSRAAKTLVFVQGQSAGFDRAAGLPFELVPLTDPLAYSAGQPFRIKLIMKGKAAQGVRVTALHEGRSAPAMARTDAQGLATLELPSAGLWTFYAVHIEPAPRPPADWESIWASLTFAIPGKR